MSRFSVKELDLEIEAEVLTPGGLAEMVNQILEFLLYQRNQIDLVYKTFRSFVNEWIENLDDSSSASNLHGYMIKRQREKAIETKRSISAMRDLINDAFDNHTIRSLRFLFGSTTATPKEVYTIHLPRIETIYSQHSHQHHRLSSTSLNQMIISLLTRDELFDIFSINLCPTNLFLELEILEATPNMGRITLSNVFPSNIGRQFPKSCKNIHFHLRQKVPQGFESLVLNCCQNLEVFDEKNSRSKSNSNELLQNKCVLDNLPSGTWWESDIIVRGFKEKLVKGRSIWTK